MADDVSAWYYSIGASHDRVGPVTLEQLRRLAETGALAPTDRVWNDSLAGWIEASRIAEFSGAVVRTAVPVLAYRGPAMPTSDARCTARTIQLLARTGICTGVGAILVICLAAALLILAIVAVEGGHPGGFAISVLGACMCIAPIVYLVRYTIHIREFARTHDGRLLELALEAQWSFWTYSAGLAVVLGIGFLLVAAYVARL